MINNDNDNNIGAGWQLLLKDKVTWHKTSVSVKSKLKHPPWGIPLVFDVFTLAGGREFDELSLPGGGAFDHYS